MKRILLITLACAPLVACHNYTLEPLCTDANVAVPPGVRGTYTLTVQNEDFTTATQELVIDFEDAAGRMTISKADGSKETSYLCNVSGRFIQEELDEKTGYYKQSQMFVTGMGLTVLPMFFDKASLDAAQVPSKIFEVPEEARRALGAKLSAGIESLAAKLARFFDDEATLGLVVVNEGMTSQHVARHLRTGPIGWTLLRK